MDKNKAIINFLLQCPQIKDSPLYFNFINAKDNTTQIMTSSSDISLNRSYVDGSVMKRYTFNIVTFKSITDNALVTQTGYENENVEDLADVQALIDWVTEQSYNYIYPDFGENCQIDDMKVTTETPRFDGIDTELQPNLAMYSVSIQIDYIDTSKKVWK